MSKQNPTTTEDTENQEQQHIIPASFSAPANVPAVPLAQALQAYGITGPTVPADSLIDQSFTIMRAKAFNSSFKKGEHAYYCVCANPQTGEVFSTVLGGQAVVEIIDALIAAEQKEPVLVTLRFHEGKGSYAGYYTIE